MLDSNPEGWFRTVKIRASAEMPVDFSRKSLHVFAVFFTPCIFKKRSLPFCVNRLLELRWSPARTVRSPALRQGRGFFLGLSEAKNRHPITGVRGMDFVPMATLCNNAETKYLFFGVCCACCPALSGHSVVLDSQNIGISNP